MNDVKTAKVEPSARSRKLARYINDMFQAFLEQGFTRKEAMKLIDRVAWETFENPDSDHSWT